MRPRVTLRHALTDRALLGGILPGNSWTAWRTLLIAAMGEDLTDDERILFKELTGRDHEPGQRVEEFVGVVGRRGGKSRAISVLATYVAGLCEHPSLVAGERGVCLIIAPDQRQADICLDYVTANFEASPILQQLVEGRAARELRLTNRIDVEVRASDFRRLRGPTYIAVIADESAFWLTADNSNNPDTEILNAVRPGLATTGGPLFMISSPYARRGELWRTYQRHFGPQGDPLVLVARGSSRTFNPMLAQGVVDRAMERDPRAPVPNTSPSSGATSKALSASKRSMAALLASSNGNPNMAFLTSASLIRPEAAATASRWPSAISITLSKPSLSTPCASGHRRSAPRRWSRSLRACCVPTPSAASLATATPANGRSSSSPASTFASSRRPSLSPTSTSICCRCSIRGASNCSTKS